MWQELRFERSGKPTTLLIILDRGFYPSRVGGARGQLVWPSQQAEQHQYRRQYQQQQPTYMSSAYLPHPLDPAPGPAPGLPGPRGTSVGPHLGYPSTSNRRTTLTRQHRSMDTVGPLDAVEFSGYDIDGIDTREPLAVSTHFGSQPSAFTSTYRGNAAPLSNPIPTNQTFWNAAGNQQSTSGMLPSYGGDRLLGGSSMGISGQSAHYSMDYEQLKQDYQAAMEKLNQTMNSIKTFWSPELKRERQLRREESTRISQLERMLQQSGGSGAANSANELAQLRMELASREDRIRQLSSLIEENNIRGISSGFADLRVRELEDTIAQLQDMLKTKDQNMLGQIDASGRFALENALRRVDEKQQQISKLEEELNRFRMMRSTQPRDFTDKTISSHDMVTVRMKMERSEVELSERKAELAQCQTRMRVAEEQAADLRQHVQLLKEQMTNREQQCTLLQGDVEALRQKLDTRNEQMGQKESRIEKLEKDLVGTRGDSYDKTEQVRQSEMRMQQLVGRIDGLETTLREKEQDLDKAKIRLLSHPDVIKEKDLREKIEQGDREKQRLQDHIDQLRRNSEKDRLDQQETYQTELRQLRTNLENLQKELLDRDVLLESQNEKIGDLARELSSAHKRLQDAMVDKGADELRKEVEGARGEVDKLLKMVHQLERDNSQLNTQCKQLQGQVEVRGGSSEHNKHSDRGTLTSLPSTATTGPNTAFRKRIEELEEALRESVSITAEREVHLSQQKHLLQQVNTQLNDARREMNEMKKSNISSIDKDQLLRTVEAERRQNMEQTFQLRQEALLAAIGEKDAHLAYLEKARAPREEVETIRRQKEALMNKLKHENEKRAMVLRPESAASMGGPPMATIGMGAHIPQMSMSQPSPHIGQDIMTNSADLDDAEGIWA